MAFDRWICIDVGSQLWVWAKALSSNTDEDEECCQENGWGHCSGRANCFGFQYATRHLHRIEAHIITAVPVTCLTRYHIHVLTNQAIFGEITLILLETLDLAAPNDYFLPILSWKVANMREEQSFGRRRTHLSQWRSFGTPLPCSSRRIDHILDWWIAAASCWSDEAHQKCSSKKIENELHSRAWMPLCVLTFASNCFLDKSEQPGLIVESQTWHFNATPAKLNYLHNVDYHQMWNVLLTCVESDHQNEKKTQFGTHFDRHLHCTFVRFDSFNSTNRGSVWVPMCEISNANLANALFGGDW